VGQLGGIGRAELRRLFCRDLVFAVYVRAPAGSVLRQGVEYCVPPQPRSNAIFCETRNGVRPILGAKNQATAMAFAGPRSSCVRPGAHSARRQDSRKDLTPCRMALHFVSAGAHAPHSDETPGPTATRGSPHSARRLRSLAFLCSSPERPSRSARCGLRLRRCSPWHRCRCQGAVATARRSIGAHAPARA